jgi:hypothetical protein
VNTGDNIMNNNNNNNKKTLFHIFYDRRKQSYFFRNINSISDKNMIYAKITNNFTIDKKAYILIGDLFIRIDVDDK